MLFYLRACVLIEPRVELDPTPQRRERTRNLLQLDREHSLREDSYLRKSRITSASSFGPASVSSGLASQAWAGIYDVSS
jgi:hypothetical protein